MSYSDYLRQQLFNEKYTRLSEEDKRVYMLLSMQSQEHEDIMQALQDVEKKVETSKHSWFQDFGANIAGNAVWDGITWIASSILKKL